MIDVITPQDAAETARRFKAARFPTLITQQGEWLAWDGSAYQAIEDDTIKSSLSEFLQSAKVEVFNTKTKSMLQVPFVPKPKDIEDVAKMLRHECHVRADTMAPPSWLTGAPRDLAALDPRNLISFKNGLLDITTRQLYEQTPFFFTRTALPLDYDANAPEPSGWLAFLEEVTAGRDEDGAPVARPELVHLIREMMGYLISHDTSKQVVFHLYGPPRTGKGTLLRVLSSIIGPRNTVSPTAQSLAGPFGLQSLIGKSVATITDMATTNQQHLSAAASHINAVSGEDLQTIDRKGITSWTGYLPTRFVVASNSLPNFGGHTSALAARLRVIPFENSFADRMNEGLTEKLKTERVGIINWCLDGLDLLSLTGRFCEPADCVKLKQRLVLRSDPIHGFVAECCTVARGESIDKDVIYDRYLDYCEDAHAKPKPKEDFTEGLVDLFPSVTAYKRPFASGSARRVPAYRGIVLNEVEMGRVYQIDPVLAGLGLIREGLLRDTDGNLIRRADDEADFG